VLDGMVVYEDSSFFSAVPRRINNLETLKKKSSSNILAVKAKFENSLGYITGLITS
jgi:hypothetical protein